jgi:2-polyprenyl-3-methyl-5-hydroxy-6-metoxy-1,4-benzoquinol methylase
MGLALLLFFAGSLAQRQISAQAAPQETGQSQAPTAGQGQRPTSTPYSGDLSIFEYPDRDKKLHVDRVMDLLNIAPGKVVADIGAGSGWFTVRAAARIGPSGAVYAEDINPKAIDYIAQRAAQEKL